MMDFIEHLRAKPDHVRKQIAFGTSVGFTAVIALMWVAAFSNSGALSRNAQPSEGGITSAFSEESGASLLGAIGSLTTTKEGSITVVGTRASSTVQGSATTEERTSIPF